MFQQPSYDQDPKHTSTSSSVYSPINSEFPHNSTTFHPAAGTIHEEVDDDNNNNNNIETQKRLVPDESFQSYMTAKTKFYQKNNSSSLSSLNESMQNHSITSIDNDKTPILQSNSKFDQTPKVDENGFLQVMEDEEEEGEGEEEGEEEEEENNRPLPQRQLSNKFKRLSVKLQNQRASTDSHNFLNNFQQNLVKSTKERTSYYQRLEENKPSNDDGYISNSSELSSVASTISSNRDLDHNSTNSSNQFVFNGNLPSSYNLRGSKVGDDIPARKDLVESDKIKRLNDSQSDLGGLNISVKDKEEEEEEDLSSLFIRALHSFDSSTLQSESDASICLSFDKNDLAFVHTIDESGWGEVTLIESLQRGWIPMNYFTIAITDSEDEEPQMEDDDDEIPNSHYLKSLFHSCGKFLLNPLSHENRRGKFTFSIKEVNSIRDGVRLLLQQTDCLSRSNEIVTKRPIVRKARKSLLADWYNLMQKANEFKGTSNFNKIEILTLMVYQVSKKAVYFLKTWSTESKKIVKRDNEKKLHDDLNNYPLLDTPPLARQRITEINGILFSYLGLIIGRLDLIEHNNIGCDILETIAHQIILLLRELLFISKAGSDFSSEKPNNLDSSLDGLLSLVSDLVSGVKNLVIRTLNESEQDRIQNENYQYTGEGEELIQIASKMIKAISLTINSIRKLLEVTGDFKLNAERSYPDYTKMKIDSNEFIKQCSKGLKIPKSKGKVNKSNRYSIVRSGSGEITEGGANFLQSLNDSPFTVSAAEFEPFTTEGKSELNIDSELLIENGNLVGGSFRALVYTLTNEESPPEYFFVSTFFICFRSFATGLDLIEELISRFEVGKTSTDINIELALKKRRKLIVRMFQLWMESYWNETDHTLLPTLINFFNEGLNNHLPLDSMNLIEVAARLTTKQVGDNSRRNKQNKQLIERSIAIKPEANTNISRYSMVDDYELSKINTNSSASSKTILPMPLGVGNQTSSSGSLLTKSQLSTIEKLNLTYRSILRTSWTNEKFLTTPYVSLELSGLLTNFYLCCDQSWVLSNYRPNLLDFNGLELAKQFTLIENQIFCSLKPEELLNQNFTQKRAHLKLAPNVRLSLLFTNSLSDYVIESILQPNISSKMRLNIIKTWLKIGISCLYLRNFNSLAAIITALQSHLVTRLTKVWSELSEKYVELNSYLSSIIHPEKNYGVYRSLLRNFLSQNVSIPIVPYFSLFLQDLTFVTDGNSNFRKANTFLNQKLINIDKYLKITKIIADVECLQVSYVNPKQNLKRNSILSFKEETKPDDYFINPLPNLQELILLELWKVVQLNKQEDDRAWKLSCVIQPRDN
ncbi:unnamed protein product [Candida verbasci]|uniref:Uncharacterized protein n=1 Tax=Candida verbasci TaxID=1227364 RepID=A0A9W4TU02_9ASCO|nr:unnamed protein product [Candida verbasci]